MHGVAGIEKVTRLGQGRDSDFSESGERLIRKRIVRQAKRTAQAFFYEAAGLLTKEASF